MCFDRVFIFHIEASFITEAPSNFTVLASLKLLIGFLMKYVLELKEPKAEGKCSVKITLVITRIP